MIDNQLFVLGSLNFIALLSPGPCFALVMRESLNTSRANGIYLALGLALGGFFNQVIMLIGVGLLISQSPNLLHALKIMGAIYLAHLGLEALGLNALSWLRHVAPKGQKILSESETFQQVVHAHEKPSRKKKPLFSGIRRGIFLNMSNPGSLLFFLSIYSAAVSEETPLFIQLGYACVLSFMDFFVFASTAFLFSTSRIQSFFFSWQHVIEKLTGLTLLAFAVNLFLGG